MHYWCCDVGGGGDAQKGGLAAVQITILGACLKQK